MSNDPTVMHALYWLADYPVLAALASARTKATKLDGRACRYIYESALARIDWQAVSASELAFMRLLGIALTAAELLAAVPVRQTVTGSTYIALADIPAPWRDQFEQALRGSAAPAMPDVGPCAWAWDWQQWVMGSWHRDGRAEGLQPRPEDMQ